MEKISILDYTPKIGDIIKTNGDGSGLSDEIITGVVGEIDEECFFVWQNQYDGSHGRISPHARGYKYSWKININNRSAWILINNKSTMKTKKIKSSFMLGADPEFTIIRSDCRVDASQYLSLKKEEICKNGATEVAMGFKVAGAGEFGHDGCSATGELRPDPSDDPYKVAKNLEIIISEMYKVMPLLKATTKSIAASIGGHIHIDIPEDIGNSEALQKMISSMYLPLMLGEDMISNRARLSNSSYGKMSDYRTMEHNNGNISLEFRAPSAEWITTKKVATGTLCYIKTIVNEIYNNKKNFVKNNNLIFNSWNQGGLLQSLVTTKNPAIAAFLTKETIKAVKTFELYKKYKKEIDFITNPKRVMAEKNKHGYDLFSGWGVRRKFNAITLEQFLQDVPEPEQADLEVALPRINENDSGVQFFANEYAKRLVSLGAIPNGKIYLFGIRQQKDESLSRLLAIKNVGGNTHINETFTTDGKISIGDAERINSMSETAANKHGSTQLPEDVIAIGIPYSMRTNSTMSEAKDMVLTHIYNAVSGKYNFCNASSITSDSDSIPSRLNSAAPRIEDSVNMDSPTSYQDSETQEVNAMVDAINTITASI